MKIGLSLSFCIKDIARGKVKERDVKKIIASTKCPDDSTFQKVLDLYNETYWRGLPSAEEIAWGLWQRGKIEQPRLTGGSANNIENGHWRDE